MEKISHKLSITKNGGRRRDRETRLHNYLADMLTLFQSGGADNAHATRVVFTTFGDIPPCLNQQIDILKS